MDHQKVEFIEPENVVVIVKENTIYLFYVFIIFFGIAYYLGQKVSKILNQLFNEWG